MYGSVPRCVGVGKVEAFFVFNVQVVMNMEEEARHLLLRYALFQNN